MARYAKNRISRPQQLKHPLPLNHAPSVICSSWAWHCFKRLLGVRAPSSGNPTRRIPSTPATADAMDVDFQRQREPSRHERKPSSSRSRRMRSEQLSPPRAQRPAPRRPPGPRSPRSPLALAQPTLPRRRSRGDRIAASGEMAMRIRSRNHAARRPEGNGPGLQSAGSYAVAQTSLTGIWWR
jgi:hypothetical protein